LFQRERDLEPLDTPERRVALKSRLRHAAAQIQDKELAGAYREDLLRRFDELLPAPARQERQGTAWSAEGMRPRLAGRPRWRGGADAAPMPPTPEGKAAARRLASALDPVAAALAKGALGDPHCLDEQLEAFEAIGFGDPALNDLAKEIIRLRLEGDVLDTEALARHLAGKGFGGLLSEIDKAADRSGAPFLEPELPLNIARAHWSRTFESLTRMAALENELVSAKAEMSETADAARLMRLKAARDDLKRSIREGKIWADG
jgi:DNA primase